MEPDHDRQDPRDGEGGGGGGGDEERRRRVRRRLLGDEGRDRRSRLAGDGTEGGASSSGGGGDDGEAPGGADPNQEEGLDGVEGESEASSSGGGGDDGEAPGGADPNQEGLDGVGGGDGGNDEDESDYSGRYVPSQEDLRLEEVARRFSEELQSEEPVSLQVLMDRVREYGGDGDLFWGDDPSGMHERVLGLCVHALPQEKMAEFLRLLLGAYPGLPAKRGEGGWTLLHLAVRGRAPAGLIRALVDLNRDALVKENVFGALPIHEACQARPLVLATIQLLAEEKPDTVGMVDRRERFPLHIACHGVRYDDPQQLKAIQLLINEHPIALDRSDKSGVTPIMNALEAGFEEADQEEALHLLHRMIDSGGPSSLWRPREIPPWARRNRRVDTPCIDTALHIACTRCPHKDLFSALVKAWVDALAARDENQKLPLHRALSNQRFTRGWPAAIEAIRFLIDQFPAALEAKDEDGETPVMLAISHASGDVVGDAALEVLEECVRRSPESVRGTFRAWRWLSAPVITALEAGCTCRHGLTPLARLVPTLMEAWPAALIISLVGRLDDLPEEISPAVRHKAGAMFLALTEVLLHDTTVGAVPGPIRERVREIVRRAVGHLVDVDRVGSRIVAGVLYKNVLGDDFRQLRSEILDNNTLQSYLRESEPVLEMTTGLCRMNKAGRRFRRRNHSSRGAAIPTRKHLHILEAAGGNLSCLFVHLREFPALLAGH
jgi:ankyrin repeat protein